MDQQALSNASIRSFPGIQANSSEAFNVQDCSKTTNVIEKADFTSTTESKGKFNKYVFIAYGWRKLLEFGLQHNLSIFYIINPNSWRNPRDVKFGEAHKIWKNLPRGLKVY